MVLIATARGLRLAAHRFNQLLGDLNRPGRTLRLGPRFFSQPCRGRFARLGLVGRELG